MPKDSRKVRQLRRVKRERNVANRLLEYALKERNVYRQLLVEEKLAKIRPDLPKPTYTQNLENPTNPKQGLEDQAVPDEPGVQQVQGVE